MGSCAVCVLGIGGGLLFARKFGVDEYVVVVWISGLNTAMAFYLSSLLRKKFVGNRFLLSIIFYLMTYLYLLRTGQITYRVIVGLTVGVVTYFVAHFIERILFIRNKKKSLFPFQRAIISIIFLILTSLATAFTF